ncbi:MAG: glycogen debranching enzyme, partial [Actinobacteria bacterium]|nr:glycogen debranching enzyme [Actinomycetota bacterium]
PDIVWLTTDGQEMQPEDWDTGFGRVIAVFLNGQGIAGRDARGQRVEDDHFMLYFNAHDDVVECVLPNAEFSAGWRVVIDTSGQHESDVVLDAAQAMKLSAKSLVVLRASTAQPIEADHSVAASVAAQTSAD